MLADGEVVSAGPVRRVVAESPAFAPQVTKILGPPWLRVDEVVGATDDRRCDRPPTAVAARRPLGRSSSASPRSPG